MLKEAESCLCSWWRHFFCFFFTVNVVSFGSGRDCKRFRPCKDGEYMFTLCLCPLSSVPHTRVIQVSSQIPSLRAFTRVNPQWFRSMCQKHVFEVQEDVSLQQKIHQKNTCTKWIHLDSIYKAPVVIKPVYHQTQRLTSKQAAVARKTDL